MMMRTSKADFDQWRESLWSTLGSRGGVRRRPGFLTRVVYGTTPTKPLQSSTQFYGSKATFTVTAKRELRTPKDGGSTIHVEFATRRSVRDGGQLEYLTSQL